MKLRKCALAAALVVGFAPAAQADWVWSFQDLGVNYTLTFDQLSATTATFTLDLVTSGYTGPDGAYLNAVDIKGWGGTPTWSLVSATGGLSAWDQLGGPSASGGCGNVNLSFACLQAVDPSASSVDSGPYSFEFFVTSNNLNTDRTGTHVGAVYSDAFGNNGGGFGNTSQVAPAIPEPETYAMMLAGLGLLGFVARRRRQQGLGNAVPA